MEEEKEAEKRAWMTKKQAQQLLDLKSIVGLSEFNRAVTLHAVAKLIATNDQVCYSQHLQVLYITYNTPEASCTG
jgi:hypothetical protein